MGGGGGGFLFFGGHLELVSDANQRTRGWRCFGKILPVNAVTVCAIFELFPTLIVVLLHLNIDWRKTPIWLAQEHYYYWR